MVISRLNGGLGNQMFQFAFGKRVSMANDTDLKLDLSSYRHTRQHNGFELGNVFRISCDEASTAEIKKLLGFRENRYLLRFFRSSNFANKLSGPSLFSEPHYNIASTSVPEGQVFLDGYWQSESYFVAIENVVREMYSFAGKLNESTIPFLKRIQNSNAVSVHIRRGDYLAPRALAMHGLCGLDFYHKAASLMQQKTSAPTFFVFTDDPGWARANLKLSGQVEFVEGNVGNASYIDMLLMSKCCHHIIANSSFSWWGAWLNPSKDKIVIAPSPWYRDVRFKNKEEIVIPSKWIRL